MTKAARKALVFCSGTHAQRDLAGIQNRADQLGLEIRGSYLETGKRRFCEWHQLDRCIADAKRLRALIVVPDLPERTLPMLERLSRAIKAGVKVLALKRVTTTPEMDPYDVADEVGHQIVMMANTIEQTTTTAKQLNTKQAKRVRRVSKDKLGKNLTNALREEAYKAKEKKAREFYKPAMEIIMPIAESHTLREIAKVLTDAGLRTRSGGEWNHVQVSLLIKRWKEQKGDNS